MTDVLADVGLSEADISALATDAPERPKELRRPPAPTPASEERERTERRDRAERRAARLGNLGEGETLDEVAESLGIAPETAWERSRPTTRSPGGVGSPGATRNSSNRLLRPRPAAERYGRSRLLKQPPGREEAP